MPESRDHNQSFMRNLGEFFGHIARGIRTDPTRADSSTREVNRRVQEQRDGDVIYRRTTIDEIEVRTDPDSSPPPNDAPASDAQRR